MRRGHRVLYRLPLVPARSGRSSGLRFFVSCFVSSRVFVVIFAVTFITR